MARLLLGETLEQTVGILLTMSLLGGSGGTKPHWICQEYTLSKLLKSGFKKFAVWVLCLSAGVLRDVSIICTFCILSFISIPFIERKQNCGASCLFSCWGENKDLRAEWLLLSKNLSLNVGSTCIIMVATCG